MDTTKAEGQRKALRRMAPGGGGRFDALEGKLASEPGVRDPAAMAASIGDRKYTKGRMEAMAAAGARRAG